MWFDRDNTNSSIWWYFALKFICTPESSAAMTPRLEDLCLYVSRIPVETSSGSSSELNRFLIPLATALATKFSLSLARACWTDWLFSGVWLERHSVDLPDEMKTSCFGSHYPPFFEPKSVFYLRPSKESSVFSSGQENMKRRNANDGKRRPVKRTKISDNFFGR